MKKQLYYSPEIDIVELQVKTAMLQDISKPGISGPGEIPIE